MNKNSFSPEDQKYYQRQRENIIKEKNLSKAKKRLAKLKRQNQRRQKRQKIF